MLERTDCESRIRRAIDVIIKYLALITKSEYLYSSHKDDAVNEILLRDLFTPALGHWNKLLKTALPSLEASGHKFFQEELPEFYRSIEEFKGNSLPKSQKVELPARGYWDANGNFVQTDGKLPLLSALINFRNKYSHNILPAPEQMEKEFDLLYELLKKLLEKMSWCCSYPMLKRVDGRTYSLMGCRSHEVQVSLSEAPAGQNLLLSKASGGGYLALPPLFIVPSEHVGNVQKRGRIF